MRSPLLSATLLSASAESQSLRVALAKQPFSPTGTSVGPNTMATGGTQELLAKMGASVRVNESKLTAAQDTEYGAWKRLGWALGDFAHIVAQNERDGYFTVGLYATCPSMPGMVAGLQRSRPDGKVLRIGMLWLDAHPDFNTPETTRSGSVGAVRLTDPLEQDLLDHSKIQQLSVADIRQITPDVWRQLDRLSGQVDKLYIHIDMDVLDPREVSMHVNKVPGGPSSEEMATLLRRIFERYPKATAVGFATIPPSDPGALSIAALNRMIVGAVDGVRARQGNR